MCRLPSTKSPWLTMRDVERRLSLTASMRDAPKRRERFHDRNATTPTAATDSQINMSDSFRDLRGRPPGGRPPGGGNWSEADGVFARLGLVDLEGLPVH